jgi:hypothetical protein
MTLDLSAPDGYYPAAAVVLAALALGWLLGRGNALDDKRYQRRLELELVRAEATARGHRRAGARIAARIAAGMAGRRPVLPTAPVSGSAPVPQCTVPADPRLFDHLVRRPMGRVFETAYGWGLRPQPRAYPPPPPVRPETLADLEAPQGIDDDVPCQCGACPDYVPPRWVRLRSAITSAPRRLVAMCRRAFAALHLRWAGRAARSQQAGAAKHRAEGRPHQAKHRAPQDGEAAA